MEIKNRGGSSMATFSQRFTVFTIPMSFCVCVCICVSRQGCRWSQAEAGLVGRGQSQTHGQRQPDPSPGTSGQRTYTRETLKLVQSTQGRNPTAANTPVVTPPHSHISWSHVSAYLHFYKRHLIGFTSFKDYQKDNTTVLSANV